jgi:hypothetical protein
MAASGGGSPCSFHEAGVAAIPVGPRHKSSVECAELLQVLPEGLFCILFPVLCMVNWMLLVIAR